MGKLGITALAAIALGVCVGLTSIVSAPSRDASAAVNTLLTYNTNRTCEATFACAGRVTFRDFFGNYEITDRRLCGTRRGTFVQWHVFVEDFQWINGGWDDLYWEAHVRQTNTDPCWVDGSFSLGNKNVDTNQGVQKTFSVHMNFKHDTFTSSAFFDYNCDVHLGTRVCYYLD